MNSIPPRWCRLHSSVAVLDLTLGRAYRACGVCDGSDVPTLLVCDEVPTLLVCGEALRHGVDFINMPLDAGRSDDEGTPLRGQDSHPIDNESMVYDVDSEWE